MTEVIETVTSKLIAEYLIEYGINPFTQNKSQKDGFPNHYQLEEESNGKTITLYLCDPHKNKIIPLYPYPRLEITIEENDERGQKTHKKFTEFGLDGIVSLHTGIGNEINIQELYEEIKIEILEFLEWKN